MFLYITILYTNLTLIFFLRKIFYVTQMIYIRFIRYILRFWFNKLSGCSCMKIITIFLENLIEQICTSRKSMRKIQLISSSSDCKKHSRPHSNYSLPFTRLPNSSVRLYVRSSPPVRRIIKTQIETRTIIHEILARGHETKPGLIRSLIRPACPPASFLRSFRCAENRISSQKPNIPNLTFWKFLCEWNKV